MAEGWKKIPLGIRVRHCSKGYEGWIVGWEDSRQLYEGPKVNPDGKQCRIYIHRDRKYRYAAEEDLEACSDITGVMNVSELDEKPKLFIGGNDFKSMPVPCMIWTLGWYHARELLRTPRAQARPEDLALTYRIKSLKGHVDGFILGGNEADDEVGYFCDRLNPILKIGFPITIVPTHDPGEPNRGLISLVSRLSNAGRIDAVSCLVRSTAIIPQHHAEDRGLGSNMNRHLSSIEVKNESLVNSKAVLLLDDIVKTGTSLMACKKLLLDAGASEVISLALGKATQQVGKSTFGVQMNCSP